jgi:hypothetical protein
MDAPIVAIRRTPVRRSARTTDSNCFDSKPPPPIVSNTATA